MGGARLGESPRCQRAGLAVLGRGADDGVRGRTAARHAPVPPLMALLRECGARMSGLRLWPDGALILKIERNDAAMQVRLAGGDAFDADAGIVLRLPFGLGLPERLTRARDLWALAAMGSNKAAAGGSATANC